MMAKIILQIVTSAFAAIIILSACAAPDSGIGNVPTSLTGVAELDGIIDVALHGSVNELTSLFKLSQLQCTHADGFGGPPKCIDSEKEGDVVEVFPVLGSEGYFMRQADLRAWGGLDVTSLFAVYEVSDTLYSDENFPIGKYAIVLVNEEKDTSLTLQVSQGNIIRIDYGFEYPPSIPAEYVVRYLIEPNK